MPVIELGCRPYLESSEFEIELEPEFSCKQECDIYVGRLYRRFPKATDNGVQFVTHSYNMNNGATGYQVVAKWDNGNPDGEPFAENCENHIPKHWDREASDEIDTALNRV